MVGNRRSAPNFSCVLTQAVKCSIWRGFLFQVPLVFWDTIYTRSTLTIWARLSVCRSSGWNNFAAEKHCLREVTGNKWTEYCPKSSSEFYQIVWSESQGHRKDSLSSVVYLLLQIQNGQMSSSLKGSSKMLQKRQKRRFSGCAVKACSKPMFTMPSKTTWYPLLFFNWLQLPFRWWQFFSRPRFDCVQRDFLLHKYCSWIFRAAAISKWWS